MIEETAIIVKCSGEYAWIETQRKSACGQCAANKACGTSVLSKLFGSKTSQMKAINQAQAIEGDTVVVGLKESALVTGSVIVYMLPIISMLFFAIIGKVLAQQWLLPIEPMSIFFAVIGLVLAGIWIRIYTARIKSDSNYQPVVLRRL
jgi:sigma-E factor negative regulatory protein RseC